MSTARQYKAFISYSHRDRGWGSRLHRALENYRIPKRLAETQRRDAPLPARLFPIFRDREELPSSASLNVQIETALGQSAYLIVICSPNSARSRWVNEEIRYFKKLGRADRILAFIIGGEPNAADKPGAAADDECFPPALRYVLDAAGNQTDARVEPIAADARPEGDGEANAILKLIAGLLGVGFDDLRRREHDARRARGRIRAAIAGSFGILVTAAAAAGWIAWQRAEIAEERRVKALLEQSLKLAAVARGQHDAGNPARAALIAAEALPLRRPGPGSREAEFALVAGYAQSTWLQGPVMVHDDELRSARFVDGGRHILTAAADETRRLWDAETGAMLAEFAAPNDGEIVYGTDLSPDRKHILAIGTESVRLFDLARGRMIARLVHGGTITQALFAADGKFVVTATSEGSVRLWNAATGEPVGQTIDLRFPGTQDLFQYTQLVLNHDGSRLVVVNVDRHVQVWDTMAPRRLADPRKHGNAAAFSRDGTRIAMTIDTTAELWDADMKARVAVLKHDGHVLKVAFSDDASLLATVAARAAGDAREDAVIWDIASLEKRAALRHEHGIVTLAFSTDGTRLVTLANDDAARMWETKTGRPVGAAIKDDKFSFFSGAPDGIGIASDYPGALQDAHFSPDGKRLLVASRHGYAQVWNAQAFTPDPGSVVPREPNPPRVATDRPAALDATGTRAVWVGERRIELRDLASSSPGAVWDNGNNFDAAAFAPDGGHVLLTARAGLVGVYDIAAGKLLLVAKHPAPVEGADFNRGRSRLVTADRNGIYIWDTAGAKWLRTIEHGGSTLVRLSPDGARVLAAARDGTVRLWDAETGAAVAKPMQHDFSMATNFYAKIPIALFDPAGARILSVSGASLRLWDAAAGRLIAARAHGADIRSAAYSPDGRHILTASKDGTARLWEAGSLVPAGVLRHRTAVEWARFDPAGRRIVTLSYDTGATLWDVASLAELGRMKVGAGVAFSDDGNALLALHGDGAIWRWTVAAGIAPPMQRPAVAYLSSFPGLGAGDRARYLSDAGADDPEALAAPDPCDVAIAGMAWRPRPSRNAAIAGISFLDRFKEAVRLCEDAAKDHPGRPHFVHNIGLIHAAQGRKDAALDAFRRAAERGHLPAALELGKLHLGGAATAGDRDKALEFYRDAARKGLAAADSELAALYWSGDAVAKDRARALTLWRSAASRGDAGAARRLAALEERGAEPELTRDLRGALLHWTIAVELGDRAGASDRFAAARRASLARYFSARGDYDIVAEVWQEALKAIGTR